MTETTRWERTRRAYLRVHSTCVLPGCEQTSKLIAHRFESPFDRSSWLALCGTHYAEHLVNDADAIVAAQARATLRVLRGGRVRPSGGLGRLAHSLGRAIAERLARGLR